MADDFDSELFDEKNAAKVEYKNIKFGKKGDWFKGTLVDNTRTMVNNLSAKKELQTIFEFKAHGGSFHNIIKRQVQPDPTAVNKGEFWSYITGKPAICGPMKAIKIGQVVGLRLVDITPSKVAGQDDTKIIKVYPGAMDAEYQGETQGDQ